MLSFFAKSSSRRVSAEVFRAFSFFGRKLQESQAEKQEQAFNKEINFMATKADYNLKDFRQRVVDGLAQNKKGVMSKFMSGNDQSEEHLRVQQKILNGFYDQELENPDHISPQAKKDIALVTECTVHDVNMLLQNFRSMRDMQRWLRKVKDEGQPLPANQPELMARFKNDKPTNFKDKMRMKNLTRFNAKDYKQIVKWGQTQVYSRKTKIK